MPDRPRTSDHARPITATMLRDLHACERRLELDLHGDASERDPVGAFVEMLWSNGLAHENGALGELALLDGTVDLRAEGWEDRERLTIAAMDVGAPLILGGGIAHGDMLGMPDVLRLSDDEDTAVPGGAALKTSRRYVAGDVKSGLAYEAASGGPRPKVQYGVQVAHYAAILNALGRGPGGIAFVIGSDGEACDYPLDRVFTRGGRTLADTHAALLVRARRIAAGQDTTRGALSSICKMCHWRSRCRRELEAAGDLTLVAELGRAARTALEVVTADVPALAALVLANDRQTAGGPKVAGVGAGRLERFRDRAALLVAPNPHPYAREPLELPPLGREVHLDLETDPLRGGLVYLHGAWERDSAVAPGGGRFVHFFARDQKEERDAFAAMMEHLARSGGHVVHYSSFERTTYRLLQDRYPEVCSTGDVERLFDKSSSTDLYRDVVVPHTEWPAHDLGLKTVARVCGFSWRDDDPGGANSIEWFDRYVRTGDDGLRRRIVDYNEDDCRATAAVLDVLRVLPVRP